MTNLGGPGFPRPPLPPGHRPGEPVKKIDMARGVDLTALREKAKHQHRWVMVANFSVQDKTVQEMSEHKLAAQAIRAKGEIPDLPNVNVPMGQENIVGVDGPGCAKCGLHWESVDGWGKLCTVSDDQFIQAGAPVSTPGAAGVDGNAHVEDPAGSDFVLLDKATGAATRLPLAEDQPAQVVEHGPEPTILAEEQPSFRDEPAVLHAQVRVVEVDDGPDDSDAAV